MNAREACESGAAKNVGENSLGLIVRGVRGGDGGEMLFFGDLREPGVAGAASGVFEVSLCSGGELRDVCAMSLEIESEMSGEFGDELFVGVRGAAAEFVIEVQDAENDAEVGADFCEQEEERYGIGAAGDGYSDAIAGADCGVTFQLGEQAVGESVALALADFCRLRP